MSDQGEGMEVNAGAEEGIETNTDVAEGGQTGQPENAEPEWKKTFKTPEEMWDFARGQQARADRLEAASKKEPQPSPQQVATESKEQVLERFVKDPTGFLNTIIEQAVTPIQQKMLMTSLRVQYPDIDSFKEAVAEIANDPEKSFKAIYGYLKSEKNQEIVRKQNEQITATKKTGAFMEGSGKTQGQTVDKIKPGMTRAEMDKILDKQGIPWNEEHL